MRVLNLYVTHDENGIYVNCETIGFDENKLDEEKNNNRNWIPNIFDSMSVMYPCNDKALISTRLKRVSTYDKSWPLSCQLYLA